MQIVNQPISKTCPTIQTVSSSHFTGIASCAQEFSRFSFFTHEHKKEITYFIWLGNRGMNVIQITDSTTSKPLFDCPQKFIAVLRPNELAIRETENKLRFIPPINAMTTNVLFAEMHGHEYIVEHGSNANYILDMNKDKSRNNFFKTLMQDLEPLKGKWIIAAPHQRY